jgi:DNA-binding transcriptional MerR regulator
MLYSPAQVAERFGVTPSTIRRWAVALPDHLSDHANPPPRGHRRFTEDDLDVLQQAQDLLRSGVTLEQLNDQLTALELGEGAQPMNAQESLATIAQTLTQLADQNKRMSRLEAEMAVLRQRLDAIISEIRPTSQDESSALPPS